MGVLRLGDISAVVFDMSVGESYGDCVSGLDLIVSLSQSSDFVGTVRLISLTCLLDAHGVVLAVLSVKNEGPTSDFVCVCVLWGWGGLCCVVALVRGRT